MTISLRGASFAHQWYLTGEPRLLRSSWRGTSAVGAWLDAHDDLHNLVAVRLVLVNTVTKTNPPV